MRGLLQTVLAAAALLGALAACGQDAPPPRDARADDRFRPLRDGPRGGDQGPTSAVDFVVQGCATRTADRCHGVAPLTLTFVAALQDEPLSTRWDFGDGSPAPPGKAEKVVTHVYAKPGTYSVSLAVGGSGGAVSELKSGFVVVDAVGPGGACSADEACGSGKCVCRTGCPLPLDGGLCLQECEKLACHSPSTRCVDLSAAATTPERAPWRGRLCLPTCTVDEDCARPGFVCRSAPGPAGWASACVPFFLRGISDPCRTASGATNPGACLGGQCLDMGAAGYCSAPCSAAACPDGARCAQLVDGSALVCLRRCTTGSCSTDPFLACELPSGKGFFGFTIVGPPDAAGTRYCAARRCTTEEECGPLGRCETAKGGFCLP